MQDAATGSRAAAACQPYSLRRAFSGVDDDGLPQQFYSGGGCTRAGLRDRTAWMPVALRLTTGENQQQGICIKLFLPFEATHNKASADEVREEVSYLASRTFVEGMRKGDGERKADENVEVTLPEHAGCPNHAVTELHVRCSTSEENTPSLPEHIQTYTEADPADTTD
ncbi:unnamed protein product [Acanthoscelides obtectus]|uniref:Uncharacterized protein n=1 Tax=Acanthoscelides obtectus TaxID=200917 RepID=A0A9P0L0I6_ACAOB|nr:unnamed protein product [Acanthoscelides obtectus]CAK1649594.1 hypothetical protein AOBTE_LOCUS16321 [Acanthoscelides obtectus]